MTDKVLQTLHVTTLSSVRTSRSYNFTVVFVFVVVSVMVAVVVPKHVSK